MEEYQFLGVVETVAVAMISVWILKYGNICRYFDYKGKLYYLSTQRFFKISHETKTPRKIHEKHIFQRSADLNLKFTFRCLP